MQDKNKDFKWLKNSRDIIEVNSRFYSVIEADAYYYVFSDILTGKVYCVLYDENDDTDIRDDIKEIATIKQFTILDGTKKLNLHYNEIDTAYNIGWNWWQDYK